MCHIEVIDRFLQSIAERRGGKIKVHFNGDEQALRFRGVAVTLGEMGPLSDRPFRRLQLAAEAGGGLGFLVRPAACRAEPSWAAVRLGVSALPSAELDRRWRVEALADGAVIELNSRRSTQRNADRKIKPSYLRSSA